MIMMMDIFFDQYRSCIERKYKVYERINPNWNSITMYLDGLRSEVQEVEQEIKDNNLVYLEDELWDILRDYMNLLHILEKQEKIRSRRDVFKRSFDKYSERIDDKEKWILRKDTKEKQKKRLINEHQKIYGLTTNFPE